MRHTSELYSIHGGKLKKHIIIHPEDSDSESDEEGRGLYASGGSIKSDFQKFGKYITSKKGGLASMLVNKGVPTLAGALAGASTEALLPEGGPLAGFLANQAGQAGGRQLAQMINKQAGTGFKKRRRPRKMSSASAGDLIHIDLGSHNGEMDGGALKQDLIKTYNKVVPKSMQPTVNKLAGQVGNYALDKMGYGKPIPTGGSLKNDLVKTYNKVVPKSMQPTVNKLAGQVGNYALDKAGYGTPIPVGKGFVKGSQQAKDHMARIRALKKK